MIDKILYWIKKATEVGISLIALGVIVDVLFGAHAPFFPTVTENLLYLVAQLGSEGLVGLFALGILWAIYMRNNKE